jgi:hypothetical protein
MTFLQEATLLVSHAASSERGAARLLVAAAANVKDEPTALAFEAVLAGMRATEL